MPDHNYKKIDPHTIIRTEEATQPIKNSSYTKSYVQKTFNFLARQITHLTIVKYDTNSISACQDSFHFSELDCDAEIMEAAAELKKQGGDPGNLDEPVQNRFKPQSKNIAPAYLKKS